MNRLSSTLLVLAVVAALAGVGQADPQLPNYNQLVAQVEALQQQVDGLTGSDFQDQIDDLEQLLDARHDAQQADLEGRHAQQQGEIDALEQQGATRQAAIAALQAAVAALQGENAAQQTEIAALQAENAAQWATMEAAHENLHDKDAEQQVALDDLDARLDVQDDRLEAVETVDVGQQTELDALAAQGSQHGTRLNLLEDALGVLEDTVEDLPAELSARLVLSPTQFSLTSGLFLNWVDVAGTSYARIASSPDGDHAIIGLAGGVDGQVVVLENAAPGARMEIRFDVDGGPLFDSLTGSSVDLETEVGAGTAVFLFNGATETWVLLAFNAGA